MNELERLSRELREMPRHRWDQYLREFCEQFVKHESGDEPTSIPARLNNEAMNYNRGSKPRP